MNGFREKIVRDLTMVGTTQIGALLAGFLTFLFLGRLLTPDEFGIVGVGLILTTLYYTLQDFGIVPAIVQRDTRIDESISAGLSVRILIAVGLGAITVLIAPSVSIFLGRPELEAVLIVFTLNPFILVLGFPSQVSLTRALRFKQLSSATFIQYGTLAAVSIALAYVGMSYWSLVLGVLAGSAAYVIVLQFHQPMYTRPSCDIPLMRELFGFGKYLLISGFAAFLAFNLDQVIIAKVVGITSLGFYVLSIRFGRNIGEQIASIVNRVLFPTMSRVKTDFARLYRSYVESIRMISVIASPVCLGMAGVSFLFINVAIGPEWADAAIPLAILSIQGMIHSLITPVGNVLTAIGKPRYMAVQSSVMALLILTFAYPVSTVWGLVGVCLLSCGVSLGVLSYFVVVVTRLFRRSTRHTLGGLVCPITSGVFMLIAEAVMSHFVAPSPLALISTLGIGLSVYVVSLHLLSHGRDTRDFLDVISIALRR